MLNKILAQLKVKYPGVAQAVLAMIAAKMLPKVTEETQIQGVIDELEAMPISVTDYANFLQQESDRRVSAALAKPKPTEDKPAESGEAKPANPNDPNAALTKQVSDLTKLVTTLVQKETTKTMSEALNEKLTAAKIPLEFAKGRIPEKAEDVDTVFAEINTDFEAVKQTLVTQGLKITTPPGSGNVSTDTKDNAKVAADITDWANKGKTAGAGAPAATK